MALYEIRTNTKKVLYKGEDYSIAIQSFYEFEDEAKNDVDSPIFEQTIIAYKDGKKANNFAKGGTIKGKPKFKVNEIVTKGYTDNYKVTNVLSDTKGNFHYKLSHPYQEPITVKEKEISSTGGDISYNLARAKSKMDKLYALNEYARFSANADSGGELTENDEKGKIYLGEVKTFLKRHNYKKPLSMAVFKELEDSNYHVLNNALGILGYYGGDMNHRYREGHKEAPEFYLNPSLIKAEYTDLTYSEKIKRLQLLKEQMENSGKATTDDLLILELKIDLLQDVKEGKYAKGGKLPYTVRTNKIMLDDVSRAIELEGDALLRNIKVKRNGKMLIVRDTDRLDEVLQLLSTNLSNRRVQLKLPIYAKGGNTPKFRVNQIPARMSGYDGTDKYWVIDAKSGDIKLKGDKRRCDALCKKLNSQDYAKGGALSKEFKFDKNFVVYVPSTSEVSDKISKKELDARVKEVKEYVATEFGGYTETETEGGYRTSEGDLIEEEVVKVSVFSKNKNWKAKENKVVDRVKRWAKEWGQEAIGFEYEGDLYYIDESGKFAKGGELEIDELIKEWEKKDRDLEIMKENKEIDDFSFTLEKGKITRILNNLYGKKKYAKGGYVSPSERVMFENYMYDFYGKDKGIYAGDYDGGFSKEEISIAVDKYIQNPNSNWGGGDSVDRELARDKFLIPSKYPTFEKGGKPYADGGEVTGYYSSVHDFISRNKLEEESDNLFGKDWEADDDMQQIRELVGQKYEVEEIEYHTARDMRSDDYIHVYRYADGGEIYKNYTDKELKDLLDHTKIEYQRASRNNWYDKILQRQNRFIKIKEVLDERGINLTEFERKLFNEENQDKYTKGGKVSRLEALNKFQKLTDKDRSNKIASLYPKLSRLGALNKFQKLTDKDRSNKIASLYAKGGWIDFKSKREINKIKKDLEKKGDTYSIQFDPDGSRFGLKGGGRYRITSGEYLSTTYAKGGSLEIGDRVKVKDQDITGTIIRKDGVKNVVLDDDDSWQDEGEEATLVYKDYELEKTKK